MHVRSRTRHDLALGAWALAPIPAWTVLVLLWQHKASVDSFSDSGLTPSADAGLTASSVLELLVVAAITVVSLAVVVNDIWHRALPRTAKKLWTALTLISVPFGALAYWVVHCRSSSPQPAP